MVADCELCKEERDVLEDEVSEVNESDLKSFRMSNISDETLAVRGDGCWLQKVLGRLYGGSVMSTP